MIFTNLISLKWRIESREIESQICQMKILKKFSKQSNSLKFYYQKLLYNNVRTIYEIWSRCSVYLFWRKRFEKKNFRLNILFIIKFLWMTERMSIFKFYKKYRRSETKILWIHSKRHEYNWIQFDSSIWKWN